MTSEKLDEIEARATAATPGPWGAHSWDVTTEAEGLSGSRTSGYGCGADFICDLNDGEYHEYESELEQDANAAFIAHARSDIPALVSEVRRLKRAYGHSRG